MAGRSEHQKTDGGWPFHPAYEQLRLGQAKEASDPGTFRGLLQADLPGEQGVLLAHLFQVSGDGIVLHELPSSSHQGRLIDVNDCMCQMLGYAREEILKLTVLDFLEEEKRQAMPEFFRRLRQSGRMRFETTLIRKDRQAVPVEVSGSILPFRGQYLALSIVRDISERQKATRELEHRARQLQKLAVELSETEDRERKRLAEILHDDLQQTLAAAKFQLGILDGRIRGDEELEEIVGQVKQMLKEAIEKSRSLSHELGPAVLSESSLEDTFEWLARQMETKHGLIVHIQTRGQADSSSEPVRAFLYKAAREILFNVVKHAKVSEASLRLQRVRNQLRLTISDKGQGFDLDALVETPGFGLLSVRERVESLGGRMKIKSAVGKGSTFLIAIPDLTTPAEPA
jgi:PAS domain S-box-containing protein